jgi:pyridoxine 4-dehydrogenase
MTGHGALPSDQRVPYEDQLAEMAALREEGKIAGIGVSTASLAELDQAIEAVGVVCVQNAFSLLDQSNAPVLDRCEAEGVAYVPYFPLGSAFSGMPKVTEDPAVLDVAGRLGASPAQVGLAWLLAHRANVLLLPGTSSVAHLEQNMHAGDVVLSDADLAALVR